MFPKMADNLQQTNVSIENSIKMLPLGDRESKRLLGRNKHSELEKCKANIETRMGTLQNFKYEVQRVRPRKNEEASANNPYIEQLQKRISKFGAVVLILRGQFNFYQIKRMIKNRHSEDQEQQAEFQRKLEQEKQLEEMEMRKQFEKKEENKKEIEKQNCESWLFLSLRD